MYEALFQIAKFGLSIWNHKEGRKYVDKLIKLEKKYYEESNKERPDMAMLDLIEYELHSLSKAINTEVKKQKA